MRRIAYLYASTCPQVKGLEASLDEVVRDFEAEKQQTMHSHDQRTSDLSLELNGLRQLIKIKNKELKTMKRLASHILQQRTEVCTSPLWDLLGLGSLSRAPCAGAACRRARRPADPKVDHRLVYRLDVTCASHLLVLIELIRQLCACPGGGVLFGCPGACEG